MNERLQRALVVLGILIASNGVVFGFVLQLRAGGDLRILLTTLISTLLFVTLSVLWEVLGRLKQSQTESRRYSHLLDESRFFGRTADPSALYEVARRFVGITKDKYVKILEIEGDGSAVCYNSMSITTVSQPVSFIEHDITLFSHPDPVASISIAVDQRVIHDGDRQIILQPVPTPGGRVGSFHLRFEPVLGLNQTVMIKGLRIRLPSRSYVMERNNDREPFEYSSVGGQYPKDSVRIEVVFPSGFTPVSPGAKVWCGDGKLEHEAEMARISKNNPVVRVDEGGKYHIMLSVEYPLVGLKYAITWYPPLRELALRPVAIP